jgi:hypothetical protein
LLHWKRVHWRIELIWVKDGAGMLFVVLYMAGSRTRQRHVCIERRFGESAYGTKLALYITTQMNE